MNDTELVVKYRRLVYKVAGQIYRNCYSVIDTNVIELDDMAQWGYVGLISAYKNYKEDTGVSFVNYASQCISNRIRNELIRKKQVDTYLTLGKTSLDEEVDVNNIKRPLADIIGYEDDRIGVMAIMEVIESLPKHKADIVKLHWIHKYKMKEIAQIVGCTPSNISIIIKEVRKRLQRLYNK